MTQYIVGFYPGMIQPTYKSTFDNMNKVRKSWVNLVKGTMLEIKLLGHTREERFALYNELDSEIMSKWAELLKEYNDYQYSNGNYTSKIICGRRILTDDSQVDSDEFLLQAVQLVVQDWAKEFNA